MMTLHLAAGSPSCLGYKRHGWIGFLGDRLGRLTADRLMRGAAGAWNPVNLMPVPGLCEVAI